MSSAPSVSHYDNKIFLCYDDYYLPNNTTYNRVDVVNSRTLTLKTHMQMTTWFRHCVFDALGQLINFDFLDQAISVYDTNGKLIKALEFAEPIAENQKIKYCCTNDGHLVLLRNNHHLEIY